MIVAGRNAWSAVLSATLVAAAFLAAFLAAGCSATKASSPGNRFPPGPSSETTFGYLVHNEDCRCEEYTTTDKKFPVRYSFKATYRMESGFITSVRISFKNLGRDTLFLDPGSVMVSSKNINYQYNNKFLPLPDVAVAPGGSDELDLDGKEVTKSPSWRKIAGEQLTLTLKGMRFGEKVLGTQVVTFVPENPMMGEGDR